MQKKIVITGGPGTGKSTVITELEKRDFFCMPEISREITLEARKKGVEQMFLKDPEYFSRMLLTGREKQFELAESNSSEIVFFDRGIPDINAYMNYLGIQYSNLFDQKCEEKRYHTIFLMPPWEEIYITDNERYESFEQALAIHNHLKNTYKEFDYKLIDVPFNSVENRVDFILGNINL